MKERNTLRERGRATKGAVSEILILPGGRVLAHNITPEMARALATLNPADESIRPRVTGKNKVKHELPG
jgi:hypothetical protein